MHHDGMAYDFRQGIRILIGGAMGGTSRYYNESTSELFSLSYNQLREAVAEGRGTSPPLAWNRWRVGLSRCRRTRDANSPQV